MSSTLAVQVGAVAQRAMTRTLRQPGVVIPPIVFPLALLAVNAAGLRPSTLLPGFPTDSFLAFGLAVPFIQGALFATLNAGADFARDAQTGFLNRLSLTALRGSALLAGQLTGIVVLGLIQTAAYIAFGLAAGVEIASGVGGVLVIFAFSILVSIGFGALGSFLALRTASGEAVQGMFPLFFVFLLISSMNTPRHLIGVDWFRFVATANPVSYLLECIRSLIITGWDGQALAAGFGVALAICAVTLTLASVELRRRLTRT
ncbi:MAG: ABC transporter permease [Gaiella sp.]